MIDAGQRYDAKRAAGISGVRRDGSQTSRETDVQSGAAEKFVCDCFDVTYNDQIYDNHGDGGFDFRLGEYTVEVVHLGMKDSKPRMTGNLIVNIDEPWRWANLYIVVRGSIQTGFEIVGWDTHTTLLERPRQTFGYGMRYCCPIEKLFPIELLYEAVGISPKP